MPRQVLVIDSNSAVQAIAALALKQADCSVKSLTDGSLAIATIEKMKPQLVLCAKEIAGVDAIQLCQQIRSSLPETLFILLAPAETPKEVIEQAKQQGYSDVLFTPFKSNRLKDAALRVLEGMSEKSLEPGIGVSLQITDKLTRTIVERLLHNIGVVLSDPKASPVKAAIIIADSKISKDTLHCGRPIIVICEVSDVTPEIQRSPNAQVLARPLTFTTLMQHLSKHIVIPEQALKIQARPLEKGELSLYAAKTSAAIFDALLSQPCFKQRNWEEAANIARDEVLKLGRELDGKK